MAASFSPTTPISRPSIRTLTSISSFNVSNNLSTRSQPRSIVKCESSASAADGQTPPAKSQKLEIGSPVIVIEAPKMIKTAASVPCLRVNSGIINPGDVGRIVSRKPKDVWAVRLKVGTYLIDGRYFRALELDQ
ncbi:hypothetical protein IC582_009763 [Cucumis melo]|uniref:Uncharacterized protein LOC103491596 n=2 Tax=Cucumis melo TaxID=3656 RepID=A0A1S3BMX2_CUCME|nr:protein CHLORORESPIRATORY REDUCTION 42, chloroplastic [Cucumis melo]KAA0040074.1 chlororespiratory reduction 42 [Cucumis melo var. makuwa]TYK21698.1 chlororespiratory reduction 42 [Cucumis melo var. makuwa]